MQSYAQYWETSLTCPGHAVDNGNRSPRSAHTSNVSLKNSAGPHIPFDASRLPVIERKKIGRPCTPTPPTTPSRDQVTGSTKSTTPKRTPTFSSYLPTPTPSLTASSDGLSTPSDGLPITPNSPPRLSDDYDEPESPTLLAATAKLALWDTAVHAAQDFRLPHLALIPELELHTAGSEGEDAEPLPPLLLHHVRSDGGAVAALKRFERARRQDQTLAGMSLFLNCPKRRVPFPSDDQLQRQTQMALDWLRLRDRGGVIVGGRGQMCYMVHAVHTMNLGSRDSGTRLRSFVSLMTEMRYAQMLGIETLVFQYVCLTAGSWDRENKLVSPGSTGTDDQYSDVDLCELANDLILLLDQVPDITLAIENSTHRCRGQLGRSIPDLAYLIRRVGRRLKVCLDLCHLHVDQYDLSTSLGQQQLFFDLDQMGWDNIAAVHVSDSLEVHGGRRDLHAKLGCGSIGLNGLREILRLPNLLGKIPFLIESPSHSRTHSRRRRNGIRQLEDESARLERAILTEMVEASDEDWRDEQSRSIWWADKVAKRRAIERRIGRMLGKTSKFGIESWRPVREQDDQQRRRKTARLLSMSAKRRRTRSSIKVHKISEL